MYAKQKIHRASGLCFQPQQLQGGLIQKDLVRRLRRFSVEVLYVPVRLVVFFNVLRIHMAFQKFGVINPVGDQHIPAALDDGGMLR